MRSGSTIQAPVYETWDEALGPVADITNERQCYFTAAVPAGTQDDLRYVCRWLAMEPRVAAFGTAIPDLVPEKRRLGIPGQNRNDINAVAPDFQPERIAESTDGEFAGGINRMLWGGDSAEDAADVDDLAVLLPAQDRQDGLGAAQERKKIDFHHAPGVVHFHIGDRGAQAEAGIVDEDINPAKFAERDFNDPGHGIGLGDVGWDWKQPELRVFAGDLSEQFVPTRDHDDARAGPAERERGFFADAAGGTGDNYDLVVKMRFHGAGA